MIVQPVVEPIDRFAALLFPLVDAAVIVSGMITASPASRTVSNYARALLIGL